MLCIKPANESNGTGVARFSDAQQLSSLGMALLRRPAVIPPDILHQPHDPVRMRPGCPPHTFVVEPFVNTDGWAPSAPQGP